MRESHRIRAAPDVRLVMLPRMTAWMSHAEFMLLCQSAINRIARFSRFYPPVPVPSVRMV